MLEIHEKKCYTIKGNYKDDRIRVGDKSTLLFMIMQEKEGIACQKEKSMRKKQSVLLHLL